MLSIDEINKFRTFNKLKSVYRLNSVKDRKESSAEHSWSCLLLADLLLSDSNLKIDKLKVYDLLIYHDLIEISVGDSPLHPSSGKRLSDKYYKKQAEDLARELPKHQQGRFIELFIEFSNQKTKESKFAKLIDVLDAAIHELDYKEDWLGWSKEFFEKNKAKNFFDFPEFQYIFEMVKKYLIENKYLDNNIEYLVKKGENYKLPKNPPKQFNKIFEKFTLPFMDDKNFAIRKKPERLCHRNNGKATYIVSNEKDNLYSGKLWEDRDTEFIANMDYMYCLPSWDWWINPMYDYKKYRKEYLNHIPGKYGYSVIFVNNNKTREKEFIKTLENEGYKITEIRRQYEDNPIEYFMFYDYYRVLLPLKLAKEVKRINLDIKQNKTKKLYFILRGGYLLASLLNVNNEQAIYINPNQNNRDLKDCYIIDDCLVMARTLDKLGLSEKSKFNLSCLDCAIPKNIYDSKYPNAKLSLPNNLINIFSCRLFEKNPYLIGIDLIGNKAVYYDSPTRNKFINEIQTLASQDDLDSIVLNTALDIYKYEDGVERNPLLERVEYAN